MNKWKAVRFRSIHRPSGPKSAAALTASALAVLLLVLAAVVPSSAGGAMRYVDGADGSDTGDCANAASPCQTIAYAIGQAAADDVVAVAGGVYQENLHVDKMLTLQGGYEPAGWTRDIAAHETVIDGSGSAPAIGDWDGRFVKKPAVIKDADLYKMWYDGGNLVGDIAVGLAISGDGVSWKKAEQNPVLEANASGWEAGGNEFGTTVIKDNGTYKMWYERDGEGGRQLGYATSSNGIDWDKYAANPVLSPGPDGFDANGVGHGSVIRLPDVG